MTSEGDSTIGVSLGAMTLSASQGIAVHNSNQRVSQKVNEMARGINTNQNTKNWTQERRQEEEKSKNQDSV